MNKNNPFEEYVNKNTGEIKSLVNKHGPLAISLYKYTHNIPYENNIIGYNRYKK